MRLWRLILANCRRLFAQPSTIIFLIAVPVGILLFQNLLMSGSETASTGVYVDNRDRGALAEQVLDRAGFGYDTVSSGTDPLTGLEDYTAELVYVFPEDFSERIEAGELPQIIRHARDESALFESYDGLLDQQVRQVYLANRLDAAGAMTAEAFLQDSTVTTSLTIDDYEFSFVYVFAMLMIVYFIMLFSSATGTDLLELRDQRVTARMFVSPNHSLEIMVALAVSYFLLTFLGYGIVVTAARYVFDMQQFPLGMTLLIIALMSLFSLSLSLFTAKITKNKSVIQLIPTFYGMLGFMATLFGLMERTDTGLIVKAGYASPIFWVKEMLINGDVLKNAGIILLMSLVLLTAGSYNLRSFVED